MKGTVRMLHVLSIAFMALAVLVPACAIAEEAVKVAAAVAVAPVEVSPINQILNLVLPALQGLILALLAWVAKNGKTWVAQKASEANTKESAAWYSTALYLAGIGVKYAEAKFGPDKDKGKEKKEAAVDWLRARIQSIDPSFFVKTPAADKFLESLVEAAYADIFLVVSPLAPSRA